MADSVAHLDCNRTGEVQTVRPETGEVESEPCPGCLGAASSRVAPWMPIETGS